MKNFFKILFLTLSVSFTESALASSGAYLAGRQAISDHNFVTASKFQAKSVSTDPSNSKLLESLMISFIAQGSVDKAITIAETHKIDGNLSQISQMILSAAMIKEGQNKTLLNFLNNSDEITPILKDLLSAWILMGLNDENLQIAPYLELSLFYQKFDLQLLRHPIPYVSKQIKGLLILG